MFRHVTPRNTIEIGFSSFLRGKAGRLAFSRIEEKYTIFHSASEAIYFYFRTRVPKGKVVGVPLYTCASVINAIHQAGFKIEFLDISVGPRGYSIPDDVAARVDVLFWIHYFGLLSADLNRLRKRFPEMIVLEDCAHLHPEAGLNEDPIVRFYSFNFHKPIAAGAGGALYPRIEDSSELRCEKGLTAVTRLLKAILKNYSYWPPIYPLMRRVFGEGSTRAASVASNFHPLEARALAPLFYGILGNQFQRNFPDSRSEYLLIPEGFRLPVDADTVRKLSYFPVFFPGRAERERFIAAFSGSLDLYLLWKNCISNASFLRPDLNPETYPNTLEFLEKTVFLPEPLFVGRSSRGKRIVREVASYLAQVEGGPK